MAKRNSPKRAKKKSAPRAQGPSTPVWRDLTGIALLTAAIMMAIAVLTYVSTDYPGGSNASDPQNLLGIWGAKLAHYMVNFTFGRWLALVIPFLVGAGSLDLLLGKGPRLSRLLTLRTLLLVVLAVTIWGTVLLIQGTELTYEPVGMIGYILATSLDSFFGDVGAIIILSALVLMTATVMLRIRWAQVGRALLDALQWVRAQLSRLPSLKSLGLKLPKLDKKTLVPLRQGRTGRPKAKPVIVDETPEPNPEPEIPEEPEEELPRERPPVVYASRPPTMPPEEEPEPIMHAPSPAPKKPAKKAAAPKEPEPVAGDEKSVYYLPKSDLLVAPDDTTMTVDPDELQQQADMLEERLAEFGVEAKVIAIHPGPVITRYDLKPAPGVKVSKFAALSDDLALSLTAARVRIIAPIPGAGAVGIEVPNPKPRIVRLREIIESDEFQKADSSLTIALGKTAQGEDFVADLAEMPHLLIAGTTGSGKSVCINTIVASLIMRNKPQEVMIAMVDPKKLELSIYQELRRHHLLFLEENDEVIATTPKSAVNLLHSVVKEMERRYDMLSETGARNIVEFNTMLEKGRIKPDEEGKIPPSLPYLVVLVDELADLMITAAREVEEPITRLAQLARAVGIHLVLATQRPSADVITGLIKANFPARIAFKVAEKTNSRIILDHGGAEALIGKGDGLYLDNSDPFPRRFHGALITTDEIRDLIAHVRQQPFYVKNIQLKLPSDSSSGVGGIEGDEDRDDLFEDAVRIVIQHQQGSVSLLQRKLKIGYSRAGRLLDQLEQANVVGPFEGSKAREVNLDPSALEDFLRSLNETD